jgi:hypothetical protein
MTVFAKDTHQQAHQMKAGHKSGLVRENGASLPTTCLTK